MCKWEPPFMAQTAGRGAIALNLNHAAGRL
jgi:hypothetical protein